MSDKEITCISFAGDVDDHPPFNPEEFRKTLTPEAAAALEKAKGKAASIKNCFLGIDLFCSEEASADAARAELEMLIHDIYVFRRSSGLCFDSVTRLPYQKEDVREKIDTEDVQLALSLVQFQSTNSLYSQPEIRAARLALDAAMFTCVVM